MARHNEIEVVARGVYVQDGHLLVCHTRGATNTYLPGGHVEFNESAKISLRREIAEELGLRAVVGAFLGAVEHTYLKKGARVCEINLVFAMRLKRLSIAQLPTSQEGHLDFQWLPLRRLTASNLEPAPLRAVLARWWRRRNGTEPWAGTL